MKRSIPALLVSCAISQCALAQDVQIYGLIDTGIEYVTNVGPSGDNLIRAARLSGGYSPSRIGFRGTEDLGGGLSAVFNLETGYSVTNGALGQGGRLFGRAAYVGLSGKWGTLTFGRHQEMLWLALRQGDIIGPAAIAMVSFDPFLASARQDNSVLYKGKFKNITVGATYSTGRDTLAPGNCAGESAANSRSCRAWSAMAQYDTPQWGLAVGYDSQRGGGTSTVILIPSQPTIPFANATDKDRRALINGFYKLGPAKIGAGWIRRNISTSAASIEHDIYFLGASYPWNSKVVTDIQYAAFRSSQQNKDGNLLVARAGYQFSKRTTAYVMTGHMSNDALASFSASGTSPIPAAPNNGESQNAVLLGIAHRF